MAITFECKCIMCGKNWECFITNGTPLPRICDSCREKEKDTLKIAHFMRLSKLSLEERVSRVENTLYEMDKNPNPFKGEAIK